MEILSRPLSAGRTAAARRALCQGNELAHGPGSRALAGKGFEIGTQNSVDRGALLQSANPCSQQQIVIDRDCQIGHGVSSKEYDAVLHVTSVAQDSMNTTHYPLEHFAM
jgi:hypothetical protein